MIFLNIIVLILEVLYYSLFMKFSRNEGKLYRYIILFTIGTILITIFNSKQLYTYLIFILSSFVGLKYIVGSKTSLYDMLIIILMLLVKLLIEIITISILFLIFKNVYVLSFLTCIPKLILIILIKGKLSINYLKLKEIWDKNNFCIRYIFTIAIFIYVILSCLILIF